MNKAEIKELQRFRAKQELIITLLNVIDKYKSKEEPHIVLSNDDIVNVLSAIIVGKTK